MVMCKGYILTGRYRNGQGITGYHIVSIDTNEQLKVTREQFTFLLGKGLIKNCTGQLYENQVLIRGLNGLNINDLPVYEEKDKVLKTKNGDKKVDIDKVDNILGTWEAIARIMDGRENVGFELRNAGGQVMRVSKDKVIQLAMNKLISNIAVQVYNKGGRDVVILRGVGVALRELPVIQMKK